MDESDNDNALAKKDEFGRPRVTTTPPVYSENDEYEFDGPNNSSPIPQDVNNGVINYKGIEIKQLPQSGRYYYYSRLKHEAVKSDDLGYIKYLIDNEKADEVDSFPFPPHDGY